MHCIACRALAGWAGPSYDTFLFISTFTRRGGGTDHGGVPQLDATRIRICILRAGARPRSRHTPGLCAWLDAGRQEL